jgi:hypothetical protein
VALCSRGPRYATTADVPLGRVLSGRAGPCFPGWPAAAAFAAGFARQALASVAAPRLLLHTRSQATQFVKLARDCQIVGPGMSEADPPLVEADVQVRRTLGCTGAVSTWLSDAR